MPPISNAVIDDRFNNNSCNMPPISNAMIDDCGYTVPTKALSQELTIDRSGPNWDFTMSTNRTSNSVRKQPISSQQRASLVCGLMPAEGMKRTLKKQASLLLCKPSSHDEQIRCEPTNDEIIRRSSYPFDNDHFNVRMDQDEMVYMDQIVKENEIHPQNSSMNGGLFRSKYNLQARREDESKSNVDQYTSEKTMGGQDFHSIIPYPTSGANFANGDDCWNYPTCSDSRVPAFSCNRRSNSCMPKQVFPPATAMARQCGTNVAECVTMTTNTEVQELQRELRELKLWASSSRSFDEDTKTRKKPDELNELQLELMDLKLWASNPKASNEKKEVNMKKEKASNPEASNEKKEANRKKEKRRGVRFSNPIVTSITLRPYTRREDIPKLFFDQDELDILEIDRENRIPEEQVECVASEINDDHFLVSVSFPKRMSRKQLREQRRQKRTEKQSRKARDI